MRVSGVRSWLGSDGAGAAEDGAHTELAAAGALAGTAPPRVLVDDFLWGEGFSGPGGASEALRLARPFGAVPDLRLMVVGAGAGSMSRALAIGLGATVTGFEADTATADAAMRRSASAGLSRRAPIHPWSPEHPVFGERSHHHALATDALRHGPIEPVLAALRLALRPRGQLVLTETVLERPGEEGLAAWLAHDERASPPPAARAIGRALGRLGFEIRATDDVSAQQMALALSAWRRAVSAIRQGRHGPASPAGLVAAGELWMRRANLIKAGAIRQVRWQAVRRPEAG